MQMYTFQYSTFSFLETVRDDDDDDDESEYTVPGI